MHSREMKATTKIYERRPNQHTKGVVATIIINKWTSKSIKNNSEFQHSISKYYDMATEMDDRNFQIAWNNVSQGTIGLEHFQELLDPTMTVF